MGTSSIESDAVVYLLKDLERLCDGRIIISHVCHSNSNDHYSLLTANHVLVGFNPRCSFDVIQTTDIHYVGYSAMLAFQGQSFPWSYTWQGFPVSHLENAPQESRVASAAPMGGVAAPSVFAIFPRSS